MNGPAGPNDGTPSTEHPRAARGRHRSAVAAALAGHGITLHEVIGRGSSCTVHRGQQADGRIVAVKLARPGVREAAALVHREARVLRRLHDLHDLGVPPAGAAPFVVQLVAEVRDPGVAALVTTPCGSGTLGTWLRDASARAVAAPGLDDHLELIQLVLGAVHALHRIGVTHGDLSPSNIVLAGGQPVLIDLATACLDGGCDPMIRGTLPYAAPELLHGAAPSVRSDMYSIARIATELLRGTSLVAPGAATTPGPTVGPPTLAQLLVACVAPDPRQRPPDLTALTEAVVLERSRRATVPPHPPAPVAPGHVADAPVPTAPSPSRRASPPSAIAAAPAEAPPRTAPTRPFGLRSASGTPPASPSGRHRPRPGAPWWRRSRARLARAAATVTAATRTHPDRREPSADPIFGDGVTSGPAIDACAPGGTRRSFADPTGDAQVEGSPPDARNRRAHAGGRRASTAGSSTPTV